MTNKELTTILNSIKRAMENSKRHGGASTDRGLGMRYAAYDIAQEVWYEVIWNNTKHRRVYPERDDWMKACGF